MEMGRAVDMDIFHNNHNLVYKDRSKDHAVVVVDTDQIPCNSTSEIFCVRYRPV